MAAESATNAEEEIEVKCFYDGAPNYRIELKAPDFKTGEEIWNVATEKCLQVIHAAGGEASASRVMCPDNYCNFAEFARFTRSKQNVQNVRQK